MLYHVIKLLFPVRYCNFVAHFRQLQTTNVGEIGIIRLNSLPQCTANALTCYFVMWIREVKFKAVFLLLRRVFNFHLWRRLRNICLVHCGGEVNLSKTHFFCWVRKRDFNNLKKTISTISLDSASAMNKIFFLHHYRMIKFRMIARRSNNSKFNPIY